MNTRRTHIAARKNRIKFTTISYRKKYMEVVYGFKLHEKLIFFILEII